jgi:PhoPQ-activated pathogenicity-related protein
MVSQEWLTSNDVEETEWWHWVRIVVPNDVEESEALFFIGGGSHKSKAPASAEPALVQILANATKMILLHSVGGSLWKMALKIKMRNGWHICP